MVGMVLVFNDQPEDAVPYLEKALTLREFVGAYNILGYSAMKAGDMEKTENYFDAYLKAAPNHHNPYDSKGDYFMATENYSAAVEMFEKAAALSSNKEYHEKKAKRREKG